MAVAIKPPRAEKSRFLGTIRGRARAGGAARFPTASIGVERHGMSELPRVFVTRPLEIPEAGLVAADPLQPLRSLALCEVAPGEEPLSGGKRARPPAPTRLMLLLGTCWRGRLAVAPDQQTGPR